MTVKKYPIPKYLLETDTCKVDSIPYCYIYHPGGCLFRDRHDECMIIWKLSSIDPYCSSKDFLESCPLEDAE